MSLKSPQDGPRQAQDSPRRDSPRTAQDRPKTGPRQPQNSPRWFQNAQECPRMHPESIETSPQIMVAMLRPFSTFPTCPKLLQECPSQRSNKQQAASQPASQQSDSNNSNNSSQQQPPGTDRQKTHSIQGFSGLGGGREALTIWASGNGGLLSGGLCLVGQAVENGGGPQAEL